MQCGQHHWHRQEDKELHSFFHLFLPFCLKQHCLSLQHRHHLQCQPLTICSQNSPLIPLPPFPSLRPFLLPPLHPLPPPLVFCVPWDLLSWFAGYARFACPFCWWWWQCVPWWLINWPSILHTTTRIIEIWVVYSHDPSSSLLFSSVCCICGSFRRSEIRNHYEDLVRLANEGRKEP